MKITKKKCSVHFYNFINKQIKSGYKYSGPLILDDCNDAVAGTLSSHNPNEMALCVQYTNYPASKAILRARARQSAYYVGNKAMYDVM